MSTFSRIIGKVQRYASQNPEKVRSMTDKAARFADQRTNGKYRSQIDNAVRKVDGVTGGGRPPQGRPPQGPPPQGRPDPRRDDLQDPHRNDPRQY